MYFDGQTSHGWAIGKNDTTEAKRHGGEKRSAGDWSSAQLLSLYRDAKPSIKARCLEKKLIVGLLLSLRQTFDI